MSRLAILVPMLGRPDRVRPLLDSIRATAPTARVLFITTPTDSDVIDAIDAAGEERIDIDYLPAGDYARKINAGYRHTTEPLLFTGAIDLKFHPGWFEACERRLGPPIGVVGTNDLTNKRTMTGRHSTHSLVTRDYADRCGTIDRAGEILHEGYPHEFVDDELVATARHRRAWAHAADAFVEHLHPMAGKAPMDALYAQQPARMEAGRAVFRRRQRLWR
jgi:hypothetical protein